jgi:hypothetical protein
VLGGPGDQRRERAMRLSRSCGAGSAARQRSSLS